MFTDFKPFTDQTIIVTSQRKYLLENGHNIKNVLWFMPNTYEI